MTARRALRAIGAAVLATACYLPASGVPFHPVKAPKDMALVFIYRPDEWEGRTVRYTVTSRRGPIVWLNRGGYFAYMAEPGETAFSTDSDESVSVTEHLVAGKTYYLRGGVAQGGWSGRPELVFVPPEIGRPEVADCVLLPPAEQPADAAKRVVP